MASNGENFEVYNIFNTVRHASSAPSQHKLYGKTHGHSPCGGVTKTIW